MKQSKWNKVALIIIGLTLLIVGGYRLYMALEGEAKRENENAKESAAFLGDTVTNVDGVEFCVTSVIDTQTVGSGYSEVTTENNFIVVSIKIINNSNKPYDVNSLRFLLTENGNEYEYCGDALFAFDNQMYMDTINPSLSEEYTIVYEVPYISTEKEWQMKILHNLYSDRDFVYINLREK